MTTPREALEELRERIKALRHYESASVSPQVAHHAQHALALLPILEAAIKDAQDVRDKAFDDVASLIIALKEEEVRWK